MQHKTEIENLQQLFDWINNSKQCYVVEEEKDFFQISAPNNAEIFVNIEKEDEIDDIISRTIERLQDFDTDERFMELWSKDFANHNHFKPSQFLKMLQEDEASFKELARKLEDVWH